MNASLSQTTIERPFPAGKTIVLKTDMNGALTHVNAAFVETSGFAPEEVLGRRLDALHHPAMPPEVFDDLWATICAGKPWRGIVRCSCRGGEHYWARTLIVPVRKNDRTVGFMSVQTEADSREKADAATLHLDVTEKRARPKRFRLAELLPPASFNVRYGLFVAVMAAAAAGAGLAGLAGSGGLALLIGAGSLALATVSAVFMAITVSRPLDRAIACFDRIAQGDLGNEIPVDGPDEVGLVLSGLATAQAHMRVMIDEIRASAGAVDMRCTQLDREVQETAGHSRDQAERVVEVSAAMEEVSASVSEVAQTAADAAEAAKATLQVVNEGNQRMARSIEANDQVAAAVQESGQQIDRLSQSIGGIGVVTRVIKDIADQTNLLALNAAIEAARAGEQGRGFAVVADEVRKLAERTASSTGDIDRMVADIRLAMQSVMEAMETAVQRVGQGRGLIEETHESLRKITALSEQVTGLSGRIAHAAHEQSLATADVARNAERMSNLIERNTVAVARVGTTAEEMRKTAAQLREAVGHFGSHA